MHIKRITKYVASICFIILTSTVFGQTTSSNQATSLCGGQWEFFMSEIAVKLTFKIDKFSGEVYQLVELKNKALAWQLVTKQGSSLDIKKDMAINYQLFSSGIGIRHTYLINTNSGLTWQLVNDKEGSLFFQLIE